MTAQWVDGGPFRGPEGPAWAPGPWVDMRPLSNSFSYPGTPWMVPQYRLTGDGFVEVVGWVRSPGTAGNFNTLPFHTAAAAYRPGREVGWAATGAAQGAAPPKVTVLPSGGFQFNFLPTSLAALTILGIFGRYPLDASGIVIA